MPEDSKDAPDEMGEAVRLTREFIDAVGEHTCSVQVFLTKKLDNGKGETFRMNLGAGNWYARYGGIREWVIYEEGIMARRYKVDDSEN